MQIMQCYQQSCEQILNGWFIKPPKICVPCPSFSSAEQEIDQIPTFINTVVHNNPPAILRITRVKIAHLNSRSHIGI